MRCVYSDAISLGESEITIRRGATAGNGVIPRDIANVKSLAIWSTSSFKIAGTHADSTWVTVAANSQFSFENLTDQNTGYVRVKSASGTITLNLAIMGE